MNVSFEGIGELVATFETSGEVKAGQVVKMAGNGTVAPCAATTDVPAGVVLKVHEGFAAVQVKGYVRVPADTGVAVGVATLGSTANGAVKAATSGRQALVVDVANGMAGIIL